MKILVFGKSGQVANALARQHSDLIEIMCVGRPEADICDVEKVRAFVSKYQPDLVVNAAAFTAVDKAEDQEDLAYAVNRDGPKNLALVCEEADLPLVHISTDYVFAGDDLNPYKPDDNTGPQGVYGMSKLAGESAIAENCTRFIIMRTAWVYDQTGSNFPKTMLRLAQGRDELTVVADQFGNPTDAEEIAKAILAVAKSIVSSQDFGEWGVYHFCGPEHVSWAQFARKILEASQQIGGPYAKVRDISTAEFPTKAKRPANSSLDTSSFEKVFNFKSCSVDASLEVTMPIWCEELKLDNA